MKKALACLAMIVLAVIGLLMVAFMVAHETAADWLGLGIGMVIALVLYEVGSWAFSVVTNRHAPD